MKWLFFSAVLLATASQSYQISILPDSIKNSNISSADIISKVTSAKDDLYSKVASTKDDLVSRVTETKDDLVSKVTATKDDLVSKVSEYIPDLNPMHYIPTTTPKPETENQTIEPIDPSIAEDARLTIVSN